MKIPVNKRYSLRKTRDKLKLSIQDIAERAGVHKSTVDRHIRHNRISQGHELLYRKTLKKMTLAEYNEKMKDNALWRLMALADSDEGEDTYEAHIRRETSYVRQL